MKRILFILVITATAATSVSAQDYLVLQVKGTVNTKAGTPLKANDQLKSDDKLVFSSASDAVAVVNPKSGRFVIRPTSTSSGSEFLAIVKEAVTPGIKRLSTRSGTINNVVDFQTFFQDSLMLLDTLRIKVSTNAFPLNETSFFFIRYRHKGELINKRLTFRADTLLISRNQLFSVDNRPVSPREVADLQLFHIQEQKAHFLSPVRLSVPDMEALAVELVALGKSLARSYDAEEESFLYASEFYGKSQRGDFAKWYRATVADKVAH